MISVLKLLISIALFPWGTLESDYSSSSSFVDIVSGAEIYADDPFQAIEVGFLQGAPPWIVGFNPVPGTSPPAFRAKGAPQANQGVIYAPTVTTDEHVAAACCYDAPEASASFPVGAFTNQDAGLQSTVPTMRPAISFSAAKSTTYLPSQGGPKASTPSLYFAIAMALIISFIVSPCFLGLACVTKVCCIYRSYASIWLSPAKTLALGYVRPVFLARPSEEAQP